MGRRIKVLGVSSCVLHEHITQRCLSLLIMFSSLSFVSFQYRSALVGLASLAVVSTVLGEKAYVQDYEGYDKQRKYEFNPNITFESTEFIAPLFQMDT